MKIGICLPYMKAGLTRADYQAWFEAVDAGPFHSVCCGERVHGPTMDMRIVLAAAAMATSRVEITPTVWMSCPVAGSGRSPSGTVAGSRITQLWVLPTRDAMVAWTARSRKCAWSGRAVKG